MIVTINLDKQESRIQRKRIRGWRMPSNAVYVGRPTKWGNPFTPGVDGTLAEVVAKYRIWLLASGLNLAELLGKDLACWCPLNKPCHADVLLVELSKC